MNSFLMVKTHKKTGLKYLCKTAQDPLKYKGSGKYWLLHLEKHGSEHTTEIIKECSSNDELRKWGRYYSSLWNIVESDEWANLKPEEGDGGSNKGHKKSQSSVEKRSGENHPRKKNPEKWVDVGNNLRTREDGTNLSFDRVNDGTHNFLTNIYKGHLDKTIYEWINLNTKDIKAMTRKDFMAHTNSTDEATSLLISGVRKTSNGWSLNSEKLPKLMIRENNQIYTFINDDDIVTMPVNEFMKKYSLPSGGLSQLITHKKKSVNGWRLL